MSAGQPESKDNRNIEHNNKVYIIVWVISPKSNERYYPNGSKHVYHVQLYTEEKKKNGEKL